MKSLIFKANFRKCHVLWENLKVFLKKVCLRPIPTTRGYMVIYKDYKFSFDAVSIELSWGIWWQVVVPSMKVYKPTHSVLVCSIGYRRTILRFLWYECCVYALFSYTVFYFFGLYYFHIIFRQRYFWENNTWISIKWNWFSKTTFEFLLGFLVHSFFSPK